ncbi:putative 2-dehydropantoate 2-reductase [Nodosilinea nodulosa]|uniref:putative 2-dehydropantoate 2-reductase n=1 Tax=Nodosilinea nodulosa TaxID=416001 RepID=UPI0002FB9557|nr:putative 2-dehydropantoate 2-reductase [Nodosilinea nodulosa]
MTSLRYAIVGAGAVGGYYGACLQRGGVEVHFLLHSDYEHVVTHGLAVESIAGNFTLPVVRAHHTTATMPAVDVVIVSLKTTQNFLLPELLPPILGPETAILTLQNGFGLEAELAKWVGDRPILGGLCIICANKTGPGHIRHIDYGSLLLGQHSADQQPAGVSPLIEQIGQDFRVGQVDVELVDDLRLARWRKLMWNIPFNGLSVVMNATTTEMMADPNIRQLAEQLMAEVLEAARRDGEALSPGQGRHLPAALMAQMLAHTEHMAPYRTSMKVDFDEGRSLEVEAMYGNLLRAAQAAGAAVPKIEMLYHQLKAIDRRQGKGSREQGNR